MTPEQAEAHDKPVAVLRPRPLRRLVELLHTLPVSERTMILAQAIREGTLTRVGADQVLFALAFDSARLGFINQRGAEFSASSVQSILAS